MYKMNEDDLIHNVAGTEVKLVVISACHSSQLGQVLINAGVPVVVCISATDQVYEQAAAKFNKNFLKILLDGRSPDEAYRSSLAVLKSSKENGGICCCSHEHTDKCYWVKYRQKYGEEEAHKVHSSFTCKCS